MEIALAAGGDFERKGHLDGAKAARVGKGAPAVPGPAAR
jgi:hypothetical protein